MVIVYDVTAALKHSDYIFFPVCWCWWCCCCCCCCSGSIWKNKQIFPLIFIGSYILFLVCIENRKTTSIWWQNPPIHPMEHTKSTIKLIHSPIHILARVCRRRRHHHFTFLLSVGHANICLFIPSNKFMEMIANAPSTKKWHTHTHTHQPPSPTSTALAASTRNKYCYWSNES